ncbi:hypothetical protein P261_01835 [Lachnospiraceae bacterium TWA4]|nr:hypothetical protein P261_01835 [Lachnospiraceae bacterium TWA4]
MLHLMKYEFLKQRTSKYLLIGFLLVCEFTFLIGTFTENESPIILSVTGLIFTSISGYLIIAVEAIWTYYGDMKEKRGYMLFMTPHSEYSILGSKLLMGFLTIILWNVLIGLLAFGDITLLMTKSGEIGEVMEIVQEGLKEFLGLDISWLTVSMFVLQRIFNWTSMVTSAFLAITISMTFLNQIRTKGLISFILYIVINMIPEKVQELLQSVFGIVTDETVVNSIENGGLSVTFAEDGMTVWYNTYLTAGIAVVFSVICFCITGLILRKNCHYKFFLDNSIPRC